MSPIFKDSSFRTAAVITLIFLGTGLAFLLLGLAELSAVLFLLLPVITGLSIGALPHRNWAIYGSIIAVVSFLLAMLVTQLSGLLCIVMAIPLLIPFLFLGVVITHLIKRYRQIKSGNMPVLLLPLLLFIVAAPLEKFAWHKDAEVIEVKTERIYNFSSMSVYDAIKSVDTVIADKPFLMHFDLPVPVKCVLEKEEVGGVRTCYFKGGNLSGGDFGGGMIVEKITALEKGKLLKMDVIDYNLIGRKWLGFKEAIYQFDSIGDNQCKLTRMTSYTSVLRPRWYWEPLEKLGIEQEHQYILDYLQNTLSTGKH